jgi:hypothetical protein
MDDADSYGGSGFVHEALLLLRSFLPLFGPFSQSTTPPRDQQLTLGGLMIAAARTSESVLLLCAYEQLWDAEMLARSALEASIRFCYLLQDPALFEPRHQEFAEGLWQIGRLKDHQKQMELLSRVDSLDENWRPSRARLLSGTEQYALAAKYPRVKRRSLDQKWGFNNLIRELSQSGDPLFKSLSILSAGYSDSSHLQHADFAGVMMALERSQRADAPRRSIELLHRDRLISDVFVAQYLRLRVAYRFIGADPKCVQDAFARFHALVERGASTMAEWLKMEYD